MPRIIVFFLINIKMLFYLFNGMYRNGNSYKFTSLLCINTFGYTDYRFICIFLYHHQRKSLLLEKYKNYNTYRAIHAQASASANA